MWKLLKAVPLAVVGGFLAPVASGSLVTTPASTSGATVGFETSYDGNILANDLIENGSSALSGSPATTGSVASYAGTGSGVNSWTNLTDGAASTKQNSGGSDNDLSHDTYFDGPAISTNPTVTYTFNTTANPAGYTLTRINTVSGWADTQTFSNQYYTVSVALVGNPTQFNALAAVTYNPFANDGSNPDFNSSQVTLTDTTGALATGVAAIRFAINSNGGSGQVFREIDVTGAPTPEPASLGVLGLAATALLSRRRRAAAPARG